MPFIKKNVQQITSSSSWEEIFTNSPLLRYEILQAIKLLL